MHRMTDCCGIQCIQSILFKKMEINQKILLSFRSMVEIRPCHLNWNSKILSEFWTRIISEAFLIPINYQLEYSVLKGGCDSIHFLEKLSQKSHKLQQKGPASCFFGKERPILENLLPFGSEERRQLLNRRETCIRKICFEQVNQALA